RHPRGKWPGFVSALVEACERRQIPPREDANADSADGTFRVPFGNTRETGRVSSAIGYLTDAVRRRPNLEVISGAAATRLLIESGRVTRAERARGAGRGEIRGAEKLVR